MRILLMTAAAAAALMATPALAQETPLSDPAAQPPSTDPVGAPPTEAPPATEAEATVEQEAVTTAPTPADLAEETPPETESANDIVDVLRADAQFSTLVSALDATGLSEVLETDDSISILAPTNTAFDALPEGELERLMAQENLEELADILLYHVINADVRPEQIEDRRGPVMTGSGAHVLLDGVGEGIRADNATVTNADLRGSNGGIFALDQVLNPETSLAAQGDADATLEEEAAAEATVETPEATAGADEVTPETAAAAAQEAEIAAEAAEAAAEAEMPAEPAETEEPTTPES